MSQKSSWTSNIAQIIVMILVLFLFNKYACSREEVTVPEVITPEVKTTEKYSGSFKVLEKDRKHIIDTLCIDTKFTRPLVTKTVNMIVDRKEEQLDSLVKNKALTVQEASTEMNLFIRKLMYGI